MAEFEKLGAFYLGRRHDMAAGRTLDELVLYDSKDLCTHAVCVGMTGSGKTGLCLSLLEEAAIDGIPAIAIDPKGDLGNLMLTFPELRPADFLPWVDPADAARKGLTLEEHAARVAETWKTGLAEWGQDGDRIRRFRDAVDVCIYTPGSTAGLPLALLRAFTAPAPALRADAEALRERLVAAVSALLSLLRLDADPVRSRDHVLLATILEQAWSEGRDADIASLIRDVQSPPVQRIGVFDLETFHPAKERMALAMALNTLLASPGVAGWTEGEALDAGRLLFGPDGRPRLSIVSIAHLSDAERMAFVTLLLSEVVAWMRTQPGTSSLRAVLYMDEVFGYLPPTANPPSKQPLLTLLKQARAHGLGVVLATQNPADLDYKALTNAGTWFIGRLQAERDKLRMLEGLEGAGASAGKAFDRQAMERTLAGLESRVFLLHDVHEDAPVTFRTRWALSYLRGPLTRAQVQDLMAPRKAAALAEAGTPAPGGPGPGAQAGAGQGTSAAGETTIAPPIVAGSIPQVYLAPSKAAPPASRLCYRPALLAEAGLHFVSAKDGVDEWQDIALLAPLPVGGARRIAFDAARRMTGGPPRVSLQPDAGATFAELPSGAGQEKNHAAWRKDLEAHLYREEGLQLWKSRSPRLASQPGESEGAFRGRLAQAAREERDLAVGKLKAKYAPRLARLEERIRKAEERIERERSQYGASKVQAAISVGATILGALLGRKAVSAGSVGRATTAMRGASRAAREKDDIARADEDRQSLADQLAALGREFEDETDAIAPVPDPAALELEENRLAPRKSDVNIRRFALAWEPCVVLPDGSAIPLT